MKITIFKNATFAFIFGFGLCFSACSSSDEQEDEQMESSDQEEAAQAADSTEAVEESEEEAMEQQSGEEGEDGYVASEEEEGSEEVVEEPTLPDDAVAETETDAPVEEEYVEEMTEEAPTETVATENQEKWAPQGNTGESFDYIIKRGDTVSGVAKLVYGSMSQWREISNASGLSNPDLIFPGSVLKVPLLNDQARQFNESYANGDADQMDGEEVTVTVEAGDTLSSIAEAQLGDSSNWAHIYGQNRTQISDPDMLRVGQVLKFVNKAH